MSAELISQVGQLDVDAKTEFFRRTFEALTIAEVLSLVKHLEEAWDVEAKPQGQGFAPPLEDEEPAEQTAFDVVVTAAGASKLELIKAVRAVTGLKLKDSKALITNFPAVIKSKMSKDEAESAKKTLLESGATVELK